MNDLKALLFILLMLLAALGSAAQAQDNGGDVPPFASVEQGVLILNDSLGEARDVFSAHNFQHLAWNAEGTKLAFILRDRDYVASLGVVDAASSEVILFQTERLEYGFNLNWTLDGRILFATYSPANEPVAGGAYLVDIQAVMPETGAIPEVLGSFEFGTGCGGGSPLPADRVYWSETSGFRGFFLTLTDTPYGILHSLNCGGVGVGLLDPATGETITIAPNFAKVVASPDRSHAVGVELDFEDHSVSRTLVYDLHTLEAVEVSLAGEPDQIMWSSDGENLYYSTRTPGDNLIAGLTDDQRLFLNELFGSTMEEVPSYVAAIRRVHLTANTDEILYQGNAYAIGRIVETGGTLYFSQIPNLDVWLEKLLNGDVPYDDFESGARFVEPALLSLTPQVSPEALFLGWFDQFTPVIDTQ